MKKWGFIAFNIAVIAALAVLIAYNVFSGTPGGQSGTGNTAANSVPGPEKTAYLSIDSNMKQYMRMRHIARRPGHRDQNKAKQTYRDLARSLMLSAEKNPSVFLDVLQNTRDAGYRREMLDLLRKTGKPEVFRVMLKRYDSLTSPDLRLEFMSEMGNFPIPDTFEFLKREVEKADNTRVRRKALMLLGRFGPEKAFETVRNAAENDPDVSTRIQAINTMARFRGHDQAGEYIRNKALNAPEADIRRDAVMAYGIYARDKALPLLVEVLNREKEKEVKRSAVVTIQRTGKNSPDKEKFIDTLREFMHVESDTSIRKIAEQELRTLLRNRRPKQPRHRIPGR